MLLSVKKKIQQKTRLWEYRAQLIKGNKDTSVLLILRRAGTDFLRCHRNLWVSLGILVALFRTLPGFTSLQRLGSKYLLLPLCPGRGSNTAQNPKSFANEAHRSNERLLCSQIKADCLKHKNRTKYRSFGKGKQHLPYPSVQLTTCHVNVALQKEYIVGRKKIWQETHLGSFLFGI